MLHIIYLSFISKDSFLCFYDPNPARNITLRLEILSKEDICSLDTLTRHLISQI